jgi:hypothetical protein
MSTQVQIRKGNTIQTAAFTGAIAELTVDTDKKTLVVHDGVTAGGIPLARESALSANQAFSQAAFNAANSAATLSAATDLTQNNSIAAAFLAANSAVTLSDAIDLTQNTSITASFIAANSSGVYANAAFIHANASFAFANTISGGAAIDNVARVLANSAATLSEATDLTQNNSIAAAFTQANTAVNNALSASNYANAAFLAANTAATLSDATDATQNNSIAAAFTRANKSISANAGGTITGDLVVTGNLTISGQTTYANTISVQLGDNIITLNSETPTSLTPTENAGIEVNRGNTFANSSLLWIESSGKWQANSGSSTGAYFLADESVVTAAFLAANSAATLSAATDATQNTNITNAQNTADAAFLAANSAATLSNATDLTQNNSIAAAFTRANNSISANAGGTITGDLVVTGNLTISGTTTYANTQQLLVGDNLITLNAELPTSVTPVESAGIEINRGNTFANSSLLWVESAGKWQANTGSATGAYFLADEAATTSAGIYANGAFTQANTDVTNVSVAAGTYGNTTHYGVVTVAANGRVTSVQTFAVSDPSSLAFSIALG